MVSNSSEYIPRIADQELQSLLESAGAVLIEGPRACGKTETARRCAASEVLLDIDLPTREAALLEPAVLLAGNTPRLIDEWQLVPEVWNHVRREVDRRKAPGQFILTGSSVPSDDATRHTGAGRFLRLRMRPMTLFESGSSTGAMSLRKLMAGEPGQSPEVDHSLQATADMITRGGWPGMRHLTTTQVGGLLRGYVDEISRGDIQNVDGIDRDPILVRRFLSSLARNTATLVKNKTLAEDAGGANSPLDYATVRSYLAALERLMVLEEAGAWSPNIRSKSRLRVGTKRMLVDPSVAVAALRLGPDRLIRDLKLMGFLFENLAYRELRVYAQALGGELYHYTDNTELEVDAVVETPEGTWAAFEVKLGFKYVDEAAQSLLRLAARVDEDRHGPPAALGVIVPKGYGYRRPDGVHVIPIGALGP